jgi:hypothetical protein
MAGEVPVWPHVDYSTIELRCLAHAMAGRSPETFRDLYMQQPQPPRFAEVAWEKLRARPATFSWGDPIPGLWDVPGYPELTTAQLEQVMNQRGCW